MPSRNFTLDELEDLDVPWTNESYDRIDKRRWYTVIEVVFKHEDKFYRGEYMEPATEMQEMDMADRWNTQPDGTVTFTEVKQVPVTTIGWEQV